MSDEVFDRDSERPARVEGVSERGGDRDYDDRSERGGRRGGRNDDRGERTVGPGGKVFFKKKVCKFCTQKLKINYKEVDVLRRFITERGKILPRRITGTCSKHQRALAGEIKKARLVALLPFVSD
jgi:small subunit ribosomal protein S18